MKYSRKQKGNIDKQQVVSLAAATGYSPVIIELLMIRGFENLEKIEQFIHVDSISYSSPEAIPGFGAAVRIIRNKIKNNSKIVVYGDYDVDGICGTSIFIKTFRSLGFLNFSYYIPDRLSEGYGLNLEAVKKIKEQGAELIITVDCGISNKSEISFARDNGIEVIVTDHHSCPADLPACTIVNPKLSEEASLHMLCGAAVAMKVCEAFADISKDSLMLAAMATIADMVPLTGENRRLVKEGLELINNKRSKEIARLIQKLAGDKNITSIDLAFSVLPAINAAGRIHRPEMCVDLLSGIAGDHDSIIDKLSQLNSKRKAIEEKIINSAIDKISKKHIYMEKSIILADESWHVGVLGIAASRIKNLYYRPVILLSKEGGIYKGSCRSIEGIHLFEILNSMPELFLSYGGHAAAAGITIAEENYPEFVRRFSEWIACHQDDLFSPYKHYDMELATSEIDQKLVNELKLLEPFGTGNPEPRFLLKGCTVNSFSKMGDGRHYRAVFDNSGKGIRCVRFHDVSIENTLDLGLKYDLIVSASINEFNGYRNVQGLIEHAKCSVHVNDLSRVLSSRDLYKVTISQLLYNKGREDAEAGTGDIKSLKKYLQANPFGCLVLVASPEAAEYIIKYHEDIFDLTALSGLKGPGSSNENQIIFAPDIERIDMELFQYVCLVTTNQYKEHINSLPSMSNRIIIDENNDASSRISLEISVDELRGIYKLMIKSRAFTDEMSLSVKSNLDLWKYRIAKKIFMELDLLANGEDHKYYIKNNKKVDLESSATYRNIMRYQENNHEKEREKS